MRVASLRLLSLEGPHQLKRRPSLGLRVTTFPEVRTGSREVDHCISLQVQRQSISNKDQSIDEETDIEAQRS